MIHHGIASLSIGLTGHLLAMLLKGSYSSGNFLVHTPKVKMVPLLILKYFSSGSKC